MVMFILGAVSMAAAWAIYRAVKWVIDDTNSYYEQCRLDAIDEAEFKRTGRYDWETDEDVAEREARFANASQK